MADHDRMWKRSKNHHFLMHDLPRLSQKAVLALIGASSIDEALGWLQNKKPAELREMFEKVYKATTKSQNKRWLQRRLAEALKLKPSQYFPLGHKTTVKIKSTKDKLDSYPSSSSAAALDAEEDSIEAQPIRKSARIPKRRLPSATDQPEAPNGEEVDATFGGTGSEEGIDESETAVASLESLKHEQSVLVTADEEDVNGDGDGHSSRFSSPPTSPFRTVTSMPPPPPPFSVASPALAAAAAYKLLASRGPGAHTKESAAEVAAIVAAKRRLKAFLPGYPMPSTDQSVSATYNKSFDQQFTTAAAALPIAFPTLAPSTEYTYTGTVYPSTLMRQSSLLGSGDLNSIILGKLNSTAGANGSVLPEEEEDEIFMNLDPVLVDMDMSLLPDGRMW